MIKTTVEQFGNNIQKIKTCDTYSNPEFLNQEL